MKKLLLISMLMGAMPLSMLAQDDLYFVPKKKSVEKSVVETAVQQPVTASDCGRSVDEYNRHQKSSYEVIDGDTVRNDIIDFTAEQGVYPDSAKEEKDDFELTKKMARFDDYQLAENAAFWAGYHAGIDMWGWHSPWYYTRYGWYDPWYDPWYSPYYYSSWRYGWYDPWYYPYYGYAGYYGWYGWYDPWYSPYYGWGYPYWYYPSGGGGNYASHNHIGTGTIRSDGSTYSHRHGSAVAGNSSRETSLRNRSSRLGGNAGTYSSGNRDRSNSGNFSGYRGNSSTSSSRNNSGSYNTGSRSNSSGSFGGSRSSGSSGGGFSGGGSRGGGGGGGGRLGGRR